jgi:hypothetical protein
VTNLRQRLLNFARWRAGLGLALVLGSVTGCSKSQSLKCDEAKCGASERCVQDECRPSCSASPECAAGQSCAAWGFADGSQGSYCVVLPDAGTGSTTRTACTANASCNVSEGEFCVSGTCRLACTSHFDCQSLGQCASGTDSAGNSGHYCDSALPEQPGQFYTHCPSGTDAECDSANGFLCVGSGAGDLDAYCSIDCSDDTVCAPGFACAPLTRSPCVDTCGLTGAPKDHTCIPLTQIGPGQPFQCGSHGVTRNVCRPRKFCTSCSSDSDCLAVPNQICAADQSGAKICTELCDPLHPSCPWGTATACGIWDRDLGLATCAHRFGQCVGTGKSCEPCQRDTDCGTNGACTASSFTGERWCVDFNVSCSCGGNVDVNGTCTGGGCPKTPGGLSMICEDDPTLTGSTTGLCVGANTAEGILQSSPQTGCWPAR